MEHLVFGFSKHLASTLCLLLLCFNRASAFSTIPPQTRLPTSTFTTASCLPSVSFSRKTAMTSLNVAVNQDGNNGTPSQDILRRRRQVLSSLFLNSLVMSTIASQEARAGLLDEYGTNPTKIEPKVMVASAAAPAPSTRTEIDPSLRASYYYPTAKKRYLPRIQKVTAEIEACSNALVEGDWETVNSFSKTAENAILPLQLYVSSLDGQGLSMSTGFAKQMRQNAMEYEKAYKQFDKALSKKDSSTALQAVTDMGVAVASYRLAGRLKDDDGNIPSIDDVKRMTMRRPTVAIASLVK
ncbi:hypothetical protein ACA910_008912 [Epithemia clementina (nom. ined.)]